MDRRGFLGAILAAGIAPAVVKAANIMPVFVRRESGLLAPDGLYVITATADGNISISEAISRAGLLRMSSSLLALGSSGILRAGEIGRLDCSPFRVGDVVRINR